MKSFIRLAVTTDFLIHRPGITFAQDEGINRGNWLTPPTNVRSFQNSTGCRQPPLFHVKQVPLK